MKGNEKLHETLNSLLAEELTAINQYTVHAEMCENWGYQRLHKLVWERSLTEMKHAKKLIERILFLEGTPIVSKLNEIHIGSDVSKQLASDLNAEMRAVRAYNIAIKLAGDVDDFATREILESILQDEDGHVDEIETQQDQIEQMGIQHYLAEQI